MTDWGVQPDWRHPGLQAYAAWGEAVQDHLALGLSMAQAMNRLTASLSHESALAHPGLPRFIPGDALPPDLPYEVFIHQQRAVPTRDNWHDGFNALCWLRLPVLKWHFNRLQAEVISREGIRAQRGPVRDAITVFDENGLLLQAPDALWQAIAQRQWQRAFVDLRSAWAQCRWVIVGHALLDHLRRPFKGITAHVLRWPTDWGTDETTLAHGMASQLSAEVLARKPFTPLPVMGMPGWMLGQDEADFFADHTVFRPARRDPDLTQGA